MPNASNEYPEFGGLWTVEKLETVKKYLQAYVKALKNQKFQLCYIDGFAGSGRWSPPTNGNQHNMFKKEPLDGSAKIALEINFAHYLFIEKEEQYVKNLKNLRNQTQYEDKSIDILQGDANQEINNFCTTMLDNVRAVLFLDPFSTEVNWNTLQAITNTKKIDLWYLFPYASLVRCKTDDILIKKLNSLLGIDLDDNTACSSIKGDHNHAWQFIRNRLNLIFPAVAQQPLLIKNSNNTIMHMLCFAVSSDNPRAQRIAIRIAEHILKS